MKQKNVIHPPSSCSQQGASSTEFMIAGIVILFIALSAYDLIRAQTLRQLYQNALLEGARAAATHHVDPAQIQKKVNEAMLVWSVNSTNSPKELAQQQRHDRFTARYQLHPWQVSILSPNAQSFTRYADRRAQREVGTSHSTINQHYQYEHHKGLLKMDRPFSFSAQPSLTEKYSILDANTITLQGVYLYEPSFLLLRGVIAAASKLNIAESYTHQALAKGLIPLKVTLSVAAQSHPVQWPIKPNEAIQRANSSEDETMLSAY